MMTQKLEAQVMNDQELDAVNGGGILGSVIDLGVGFVPYVGTANTVAGFTGNSVGSLVEGLF